MGKSSINCQMQDAAQDESAQIGVNWVPLSDLAEVNPRSPSPARGETVSFVAMEDVSRAGVINNIQLRNASTGYTPFVAGDVLVAKITSCFENGKGAHVPDLPTRCGLGSTEFHVLRALPRTFDRYLYHLTRTPHFRLRGEGLMSGSAGQRRVPTEFFDRYAVSLPPLEEQRKIAEILDIIDETIQATKRVIAKHARVRAGLARDLLTESSSCLPPLGLAQRETEPQSASVMTSTDLLAEGSVSQRHIGMNNRVATRLLDIAESMVDGPFGSNLKTEHYVQDAGVRVVRLANLSEGRYLNDDEAFIEETHARRLDRHNVRSGDVLVASLGDDNHRPGRACLYPSRFAPGIVKADCFRIRPLDSVDPRFLMETLNSRCVTSQFRRLAQGVTRDRINLGQLRHVILQVLPPEEQRRIGEVLETFDEAIEANEEQLGKLRQLRSGLAADLLSGRVRTMAA